MNVESDQPSQVRVLKRALVALGIVIALLGAGFIAVKLHRKHQIDSALKQADQARKDGRAGHMVIALRRALQLDPSNLTATRAMAEVAADRGFANAALEWRRRAVAVAPESASDRLALASIAMKFDRLKDAGDALDGIPEAQRQSATYFAVAGAYAARTKRPEDAAKLFARACELAPNVAQYRFNLATLQAQSTEPTARGEGLRALAELASDPALKLYALRTLSSTSLLLKDTEAALRWTSALAEAPNAGVYDLLLRWEALGTAGKIDEAKAFLDALKERCGKSVVDATALGQWLSLRGRTREAAAWLAALEPSVRNTPQINRLIAQAQFQRGEWKALGESVGASEWGADAEYLRKALMARSQREMGDDQMARSYWVAAINEATRSAQLASLLRLTEAWEWKQERDEVLWAAARHAAHPEWALLELYREHVARQDTEGLLRVMTQWRQRDPDNKPVANNFAMYSLLLDRNPEEPLRVAEQLHRDYPGDPVFATTLAFGLLKEGKAQEALKLIESRREELLKQPGSALTLALVLAANGREEEGREIARSAGSEGLSAEEQKLRENLLSGTSGNRAGAQKNP